MAWQLIYTSAPRLLEAGRTGFGTVARHRGVSALVASAVERISQFARLSGLDSRRVIYSHRIVTVGAGQFHILSCIRDAGSDYTGRTNHLAHHLIAEAREVAALKGQGLSPADVLLQMNWAQSWTSAPRFFDPTEEVPLAGFSAEAQGSAWERITGRNDFAWLPQDPRMRRGCYIITPSGADVRELFHDSLACLPGESWATTFTTSLEPNDELADFRWIALPLGSPLRPQLDTSARTILNLTNPSTLPEPERVAESESRAVSPAIREPSVERLNRPVTSLPPPAAVETRSPIPMATAMGTMGDWAPAPTKRKKPLFWVILGAGMLCALTVIGLSALSIIKDRREHRIAIERRAASDKIIKEVDDLLRGLRNLEVTKEWLKKPENTTEIESYAKIKSWITEQSSAPDQSKAPSAAKLQPDFQLYLDAFVGWRDEARTKSNGETLVAWRNSPPNQILSVTTEWLNNIEAKKSKVQKYDQTLPRLIENNLSKAIQQKLGEIRTATSQPLGNAKEWDELLKFLFKKDIIKKGSDHDWIHDWVRLLELKGKKNLDDNERKEISGLMSKSGPPWLQNEARTISGKVDELAKTESKSDKKPQPAAPSGEPKKSLDDPASGHPIQIEIVDLPKSTDPSKSEDSKGFKVVALNEEKEMHLLIGQAGNLEDQLEKWAEHKTTGVYKKGVMTPYDKAIRIEKGKLQLPQTSEQKTWRIVGIGEQAGKVLFELIVVSAEAQTGELPLIPLTPKPKLENRILGERSILEGQLISVLWHMSPPQGSNYVVKTKSEDLQLEIELINLARVGVLKSNNTPSLSSPNANKKEHEKQKKDMIDYINEREKEIERLEKGREVGRVQKIADKRKSIEDKKAALEALGVWTPPPIQTTKLPRPEPGPAKVYLNYKIEEKELQYFLFEFDLNVQPLNLTAPK
jgi:hypothetical protein